MVAFPIKMRKEDSAISPLFGKAKYFAFYEDGKKTKSLDVLARKELVWCIKKIAY